MDLVLKCTKIHKLLVHMMTQTQALTKPGSVFRKNKNLEITQFSDKRFLYFYTVYIIIFSNTDITDIIDNSVTIQIQVYDTVHA